MKKTLLLITTILIITSSVFTQSISIDKLSITITDLEIDGDYESISISTFNWKANLIVSGFEMQLFDNDFQDLSHQLNNDDKIVINQFKASVSLVENKLKITNARFSSPFLKADIKADVLMDVNNPEDMWIKSLTVKLDALSAGLERFVLELEKQWMQTLPRKGKSIVIEADGPLDDLNIKGIDLEKIISATVQTESILKKEADERVLDLSLPDSQSSVKLETAMDSVSYSIGVDIGKNMKAQELDINEKAMFEGWSSSYKGEDLKLTDEDMLSSLNNFRKIMQEKSQQKAKAQAVENLANGEAFLTENAKKEGVVTTESGLQYKVVKQGEGPIPTSDDKVTVHYKGTLIDGEEFDSSYKRGQPASFGVTGVIKGWTEALQLMPVGSKWELYIPSNLAYGNSPKGPGGPNSTLIFEVELLGIE
jgi:FKBP-type peptidyl-prolyl cis-trans isomerase